MISLEKWMILAPLLKLPKNVGDLGKFLVAKGFKKLPKVQKIANSGHTGGLSLPTLLSIFSVRLEASSLLENLPKICWFSFIICQVISCSNNATANYITSNFVVSFAEEACVGLCGWGKDEGKCTHLVIVATQEERQLALGLTLAATKRPTTRSKLFVK